ncbi:hypothetical protein [Paraburkholderia sp. RL17-337-BIB-A]|uniref:hypothetical protein n=1 Tax=Paraburkholderia sp. RL17-337-BIB-A TaxID=3031636 RepID=UPI0038BBC60C
MLIDNAGSGFGKFGATRRRKNGSTIFLDEEEFEFDDELARQLGVAMLNVIAMGRPDIRQRLNVTQHPIDEPNSAEDIDCD